MNEGSDALFYCQAVAYPTPITYNWFRDGKQISSDPNGDIVIESLGDGNSTLTVKNVKVENGYLNYQVYSCSATNIMGTGQRKSVLLMVNCKYCFPILLC